MHGLFFYGFVLKAVDTVRPGGLMIDPLLTLLDDRSALLRQILNSATSSRAPSPAPSAAAENPGAIAPSLTALDTVRTFSSPNKVSGKTETQNLPSQPAVRKAEREIAEFRRFQSLTGELVELNRKVCRSSMSRTHARLRILVRGHDAQGFHLHGGVGRGLQYSGRCSSATASPCSSNYGCSGALYAGAVSGFLDGYLARSRPRVQPGRHRASNQRRAGRC